MHHGDWCLETIFCTGSAARIRELVYHLRDFDAVGRVNVMFLQPVSDQE
jgi:CopG family nickel-responsive transcriptional regulator